MIRFLVFVLIIAAILAVSWNRPLSNLFQSEPPPAPAPVSTPTPTPVDTPKPLPPWHSNL